MNCDRITNEFIFTVQIIEHCNLKCAGCLHFAPIADKSYMSVENFERIMKRIKEFETEGIRFRKVSFLGGEPTLHPDLPALLDICHDIHPKMRIQILTNGVMSITDKDKWTSLLEHFKRHDVNVKLSDYGLVKDLDKFVVIQDMSYFKHGFLSHNKSIPRNCNVGINHLNEKGIIQINSNGDLFFCCIAANVWKYNMKNESKFELVKGEDYINIFEISQYDFMKKILKFSYLGVSNNIPFCRYCSKPLIKHWHLYNGEDEWVQ